MICLARICSDPYQFDSTATQKRISIFRPSTASCDTKSSNGAMRRSISAIRGQNSSADFTGAAEQTLIFSGFNTNGSSCARERHYIFPVRNNGHSRAGDLQRRKRTRRSFVHRTDRDIPKTGGRSYSIRITATFGGCGLRQRRKLICIYDLRPGSMGINKPAGVID